jgi:hypothetical protein
MAVTWDGDGLYLSAATASEMSWIFGMSSLSKLTFSFPFELENRGCELCHPIVYVEARRKKSGFSFVDQALAP